MRNINDACPDDRLDKWFRYDFIKTWRWRLSKSIIPNIAIGICQRNNIRII